MSCEIVKKKRTKSQLKCVDATGVEVCHAQVQPLHHVGGVVSHPPLGQTFGQVQLVGHVKVDDGGDILTRVFVGKRRAEWCPPTNDVRFQLFNLLILPVQTEHLIDEVDGQGDIRVQAPAGPDVRGQRSRGSAKLGYRLLNLLKNLRRVLLHLPGVGRRVLHVDCLVEDGNEGFELIAVDHLKGEKSGK